MDRISKFEFSLERSIRDMEDVQSLDPETEFLCTKQETGNEWELFKENVRPLKRGRNIHLLNHALRSQTNSRLKDSLLENRRSSFSYSFFPLYVLLVRILGSRSSLFSPLTSFLVFGFFFSLGSLGGWFRRLTNTKETILSNRGFSQCSSLWMKSSPYLNLMFLDPFWLKVLIWSGPKLRKIRFAFLLLHILNMRKRLGY